MLLYHYNCKKNVRTNYYNLVCINGSINQKKSMLIFINWVCYIICLFALFYLQTGKKLRIKLSGECLVSVFNFILYYRNLLGNVEHTHNYFRCAVSYHNLIATLQFFHSHELKFTSMNLVLFISSVVMSSSNRICENASIGMALSNHFKGMSSRLFKLFINR